MGIVIWLFIADLGVADSFRSWLEFVSEDLEKCPEEADQERKPEGVILYELEVVETRGYMQTNLLVPG